MPRDPLISADDLADFLKTHAGWRVENGQLTRTYEHPTFLEGIAFVQKVAQAAETQDHHPDIDIRYRKVMLRLITHDSGGLTWRDTALAAAADDVNKSS